MSPASNLHGNLQSKIVACLANHLADGEVLVETSIQTTNNVKVADVCWGSKEFIAANGFMTPYLQAPEICVEVKSPSNSEREITEKIALYFAQGAVEVWVCDMEGNMQFFISEGEASVSAIAPEFPKNVRG